MMILTNYRQIKFYKHMPNTNIKSLDHLKIYIFITKDYHDVYIFVENFTINLNNGIVSSSSI